MKINKNYDVIVVGGGHAGYEAASAAARMGGEVLLLSLLIETIGQMSCNPSIGGLAKSQIVMEIDALGGIMPLAADYTGIQFRTLNKKKGPAVWSLRTQNDRREYRDYIISYLEKIPNLHIKQGEVVSLIIENNVVKGVKTADGFLFHGKTVIITAGTFLRGKIHIGSVSYAGGRIGEKGSDELGRKFEEYGFDIFRLKTGTSPRLDADTIDFDRFTIQPGDEDPDNFSFRTKNFNPVQVPCYLGHTSVNTHEFVLKNLTKAAMYSGEITGKGPRYCPSIEVKINFFPDKKEHQIFLEPEGIDSKEYYLNGVSTSLPAEMQYDLIRSIPGLEKCDIIRPGYAIEYDVINPSHLKPSLESRIIENLFFAGQVNGTSGYEEAAGQGLLAGINAILKTRKEESLILGRNESYIGVLIDDLITRGVDEPYRLFTSRAEHRLKLRQDNALFRLSEYAFKYNLLSKEEKEGLEEIIRKREESMQTMKTVFIKINNEKINLWDYPKKHGSDYSVLMEELNVDKRLALHLWIESRYEGYIARENRMVKELLKMEKIKIPENINYNEIKTISNEAREKLSKIMPINVGQASRIPGVSPSDILALTAYLKSDKKEN